MKGYMNSSHKVLELSVNPTDSVDTPILSAIVPVTRMAGRLGLLEKWLREVENLPVEAIIIHDIQDESTSAELREIIGRHKISRIKLLEGEFGSPGAARNAGLDFSRRTWTAFWDSDDLPELNEVVNAIQEAESSTEVLIGNFSILEGGKSKFISHKNRLDRVALNPGLWRMVFRSSLLSDLRFDEVRMGEDQLFLVLLNLPKLSIQFNTKNFYSYNRGHAFQLTFCPEVVAEVPQALKRISDIFRVQPEIRNNFSEIILVRLFLAASKNNLLGSRKLNYLARNMQEYGVKIRYFIYTILLLMTNFLYIKRSDI
jgi:glycosyltransferase involved in cell wall biosynthesis